MDSAEFRQSGHALVDWIADYLETLDQRPVRAQVKPGYLLDALPKSAPEEGEDMASILADLDRLIMPGITHWQHPRFFAYFPSISSPPAVLAEMVIAALGANGMMWETSPAVTELETRVLDWLRDALGLPGHLHGVIQDTASTSTLCAVLAARERAIGHEGLKKGGAAFANLTAYASAEAHSSVEKAARLAGFGTDHYRAIPATDTGGLDLGKLRAALDADLAAGLKPALCVATLGATALGGFDDLAAIAEICREHNIWLHVDAAWAGSALILPEYRHYARGLEYADSVVVNPHKWLFTTVDCSVLYIRDVRSFTDTFSILPEYLKTAHGSSVTDYRDWGIALGRRFRALKLWFVLRNYGVNGLRDRIRGHIALAEDLGRKIATLPDFELVVEPRLALLLFRYRPEGATGAALDAVNERLLAAVNDDGTLYLTRAKVNGAMAIRWCIGQDRVDEGHVELALGKVIAIARGLEA